MKHYLTIVLCAMISSFAIVSCDKPSPVEEDGKVVQAAWTAMFEQTGTKASISDDMCVLWDGEDLVSVFSNKKNIRMGLSSVSQDGKSAVISGEVTESKVYYALYPYSESATGSGENITSFLPETQKLVAGGADPDALLSVARTSSDEMKFMPVPAFLAISYKGTVKSLSVSGQSEDDRLAGKVRINTGSNRCTVVTGTNVISLEGEPEDGNTYYVAVVPGSYEGITVTAVNENGLSAEIGISSGEVILERNMVLPCEADFSKVDWILRPPAGQSYELKSADEVMEFLSFVPNPKEEVVDLTLSGADITDELLSQMHKRVGAVIGCMTIDGISASSTKGFFDVVDCRKDIVIKNCPELKDASGFNAYTEIKGGLTIEDCPLLGAGWNAVESVAGNLRMQNTDVRFGEGGSFAVLSSVGGNLEVIGNENMVSFAGSVFSSAGGDINITDNPDLVSLEGLDRMTSIGGNVVIFNNPQIPMLSDEYVGYCIIREYINKNIISSTANVRLGTSENTIDISVLPSCDGTLPGEPQSYTLNGKAEVEAFVNAGITDETVKNITIRGDDVDPATLHRIAKRIYTVTGTLTLENLGYTNSEGWGCGTENFLEFFTHNGIFEGSIVLRNIAGVVNPNGFVNMEEVKGSVIIENVPGFCMHWGVDSGLAKIKKIGGDMKFIGSAIDSWYSGDAWSCLEEVGGSFVLEGLNHFFFLKGIRNLRTIGGDFIVKDCSSFWGLNGLENLTWLGGDVLLSNYGKLQLKNGVVDDQECIGICLLRDFYDNGQMNKSSSVTIVKDGETIDFGSVRSCSETFDGDGSGNGEKYPDPEDVTGWN